MWWTRSSTFPHQRKLFSSLVLGTERHWGEGPFTKWKRGESPDQECKWAFRRTGRDSNPHYSSRVQWRFWLLLLLAKCNWDMTWTGGPSVCKNEDGEDGGSSACPAACSGGHTQLLQTSAMFSDMECGTADCYHHEGLHLVTGKGQVSLLHWLCLGGWRKRSCPCAAAALLPSPGNKVWVSGTEFQHKENIMFVLCFGVGTFAFDHKCSNSLEFNGLHTTPLSLISRMALWCFAASLPQISKPIFPFNWVVAISNSRTSPEISL